MRTTGEQPTSLRRSAVLAFFTFGAVLIGLYAVVAALTAAVLEDRLLAQRLEIETEEYLERLERLPPGQSMAPPSTRFMRGYIGLEEVPADLRGWVSGRPDGNHEVGEEVIGRSQPFLVAIRQLPGDRGRLFLFYEVTELGIRGEWVGSVLIVLSLGAVIVSLLGAWWGRRLADRLVAPVVHLADTVEKSPPSELATRIRSEDYPVEVAQLANALSEALERVEFFIQRERSFTRNASHELRTPVTAARGAAELLASRIPEEDPRARGQLDRIFRSIHRMEEIIEAFLWLAREDGSEPAERCAPASLIPEIVAQHRHLLGDRPVEVLLNLDPELQITVPKSIFVIVSGNLIANAFYNTLEGSVEVSLRSDALQVLDTGSGIPPEQVDRLTEPFVSGRSGFGHGLGLAIVSEICERFGWKLRVGPRESRGTRAEVRFGAELLS
ncbi:MAG: HAMP domain-containing sensor histidine kinase [Acidobacteriota bacterium]